jgi:enamine deaminase RidA (YjgF/YER057c/UK114 family)
LVSPRLHFVATLFEQLLGLVRPADLELAAVVVVAIAGQIDLLVEEVRPAHSEAQARLEARQRLDALEAAGAASLERLFQATITTTSLIAN